MYKKILENFPENPQIKRSEKLQPTIHSRSPTISRLFSSFGKLEMTFIVALPRHIITEKVSLPIGNRGVNPKNRHNGTVKRPAFEKV